MTYLEPTSNLNSRGLSSKSKVKSYLQHCQFHVLKSTVERPLRQSVQQKYHGLVIASSFDWLKSISLCFVSSSLARDLRIISWTVGQWIKLTVVDSAQVSGLKIAERGLTTELCDCSSSSWVALFRKIYSLTEASFRDTFSLIRTCELVRPVRRVADRGPLQRQKRSTSLFFWNF